MQKNNLILFESYTLDKFFKDFDFLENEASEKLSY